MLRGLPASGKSTYARELLSKPNWKRINKDDLRAMLQDGKHSRPSEGFIIKSRDALVSLYLSEKFNVVVDDTNFNPIHETRLRELAKQYKAEFEIKDFDTSVSECIERDGQRANPVGAEVIIDMYFRWVEKKRPFDDSKKNCYIFDIDGTLARMVNRSPYDYDKSDTDELSVDVARIGVFIEFYNTMVSRVPGTERIDIIICSGRDEVNREMTEKWLNDKGVFYDKLYMRPKDDKRKDSIVKSEIFHTHIEPHYNVLGVFDDRNQVVDMWRLLGLTCFQVNYGNF